jgi:hypothetical protein
MSSLGLQRSALAFLFFVFLIMCLISFLKNWDYTVLFLTLSFVAFFSAALIPISKTKKS